MKKATLLLVFCMLLTLAGCGKPEEAPTTALPETTFAVDGYALQITADSSFVSFLVIILHLYATNPSRIIRNTEITLSVTSNIFLFP